MEKRQHNEFRQMSGQVIPASQKKIPSDREQVTGKRLRGLCANPGVSQALN